MKEIIRVDKLSLERKDKRILSSVTFSLEEGKSYALIGESGEGKTTLLLFLSGLLRGEYKTEGSYYFKDKLILSPVMLRSFAGNGISTVLQDAESALNPVYKIKDLLKRDIRLRGKAYDHSLIKKALEFSSLSETVLDKYPFSLSGGMKERVLLSLLYLKNSSLILLDEPTSSLDSETEKSVISGLKRLRDERGSTILFVTHSKRLLDELGEKRLLLKNGKIENLDDKKELSEYAKVFLSSPLFGESYV